MYPHVLMQDNVKAMQHTTQLVRPKVRSDARANINHRDPIAYWEAQKILLSTLLTFSKQEFIRN
jgi:hypothetical protein